MTVTCPLAALGVLAKGDCHFYAPPKSPTPSQPPLAEHPVGANTTFRHFINNLSLAVGFGGTLRVCTRRCPDPQGSGGSGRSTTEASCTYLRREGRQNSVGSGHVPQRGQTLAELSKKLLPPIFLLIMLEPF